MRPIFMRPTSSPVFSFPLLCGPLSPRYHTSTDSAAIGLAGVELPHPAVQTSPFDFRPRHRTDGDLAAIGLSDVDQSQPEVQTSPMESWLFEPELVLPDLQILENWFELLKTMMIHSAARNDPVALAVAEWARDPHAYIEAQAPRRREAALRHWYARFEREFPNATIRFGRHRLVNKMREIRRQYLLWLQVRGNRKRYLASGFFALGSSTLPTSVVRRIFVYLQPDPDEWSTGSVTGFWQRALNHFTRI